MASSLESIVGAPVVLVELKTRPGRRQTQRAIGSQRTAIVKVYASGRAGAVAARVAALSSGPAEPRVPQVLRSEPDLGVVVLSDMPGAPLRAAVLDGDAAACRRVGAALARWHDHWSGTLAGALKPHTIGRELEILRALVARAPAGIGPAVALALPGLSHDDWAPATVIHRDLYEEQILIGDLVSLIDLDDAALGPAELDIGNLLAHLDLLERRTGQDLSSMQGALLAGYASVGAALDVHRLARCRSLALLRLACIHGDAVLITLARATTAP